jgi:hypothetical protein
MKDKKRYGRILAAVWVCIWLLSTHSYAASNKDREVVMIIPTGVLQEFINEALPVELTVHDKVSGDLWIKSIENLKLGLNKIWFTAVIHGEDIAYEGKIGGLSASFDFGVLDSTLHCEASIRYDAETRILYLKPEAVEQAEKGNAFLQLLTSLVSDREYPLEIGKIKPIRARASSKTLQIDMDIASLYTANDKLFIVAIPITHKLSGTAEQNPT